MASINKVIIVGRLGQDPEVRQFQNGGSLTSINVATSERWTDKNSGEQKEQTEWHRISMFNRLGEIAAQFLRKGSLVYIEGSLHTRKYTDSQGVERYSTEVRATQMQMLDRRDNNGSNDYQGGFNNRGSFNGQTQYNNQNNGSWNNQNHQNGGFDNGNQGFGGGSYQSGGFGGQNQQNYQAQNGLSQNTPSYPNNNSNQGFGQASSNPSVGTPNMNQGVMQSDNPFMSGDNKPAPKAVTPPMASNITDDDMPF